MATFLAIPMKKSYEVDMAGPIRTYISCTYSTTEMPTDFEAINDFNKLRNKATIQIMDRHENSLEILYRYVCTRDVPGPKKSKTRVRVRVRVSNFKFRGSGSGSGSKELKTRGSGSGSNVKNSKF